MKLFDKLFKFSSVTEDIKKSLAQDSGNLLDGKSNYSYTYTNTPITNTPINPVKAPAFDQMKEKPLDQTLEEMSDDINCIKEEMKIIEKMLEDILFTIK